MTDRQDRRRGGLLRRSLDLVYRRYRMSRDRRRFGQRSPREVFTAIYAQSIWGRGASPFYSGDGPHEPAVVAPYIEAASRFLRRLGARTWSMWGAATSPSDRACARIAAATLPPISSNR
ncbi:MAG: hypothetical protein H5U21_06155 [Porphyrobacter sp.]|nr:hypothetical protein [Porphyrobacter sp.]